MIATIANDPVLERITRTIVERFQPLRIALFGSRARGDARAHSDYDLMVIVEDMSDDLEEQIHSAAAGCGASVDVFVQTAAGFEEDRDDVGTTAYMVDHEGRTVYGGEPRA